MPDIVFTIVSRNYAAHAAVLMHSLAVADPGVHRVVFTTDGTLTVDLPGVEIISADSVTPDFGAMIFYYDVLEVNTAVKPFCFLELLRREGVASVTYLDPDIRVFSNLGKIRSALSWATAAVTPHLDKPLGRRGEPNDWTILKSGTFNLGFFAVQPNDEAFRFITWWADKCRFDCKVDFAAGLFTDQRWVDLAAGFISRLAILTDPTMNLAYWNIGGRVLEQAKEGWSADGEPLTFFHFSGFNPARPDLLSRYQDRIPPLRSGALRRLLDLYARELKDQGYNTVRKITYRHARFESGRAITPLMRRAARRGACLGAKFNGLGIAAERWLNAADPETISAGSLPLTRLVAQACREGLTTLPIESYGATQGWRAAAAPDRGVDGIGMHAQEELSSNWRFGQRRASLTSYMTGEESWTGPAARIADWFRQATPSGAPRACKALLQARADLRAVFPDDIAEADLVAWCIGPEALAGRFDPSLLPDKDLAKVSENDAAIARRAAAFAYGVGNSADVGSSSADDIRRVCAAFVLAEQARWPAGLSQSVLYPLFDSVGRSTAGLLLPTLARTIWGTRPDLQREFDISRLTGRIRLLYWILRVGRREYGLAHPQRRLAPARGRVFELIISDDDNAARLCADALPTKGPTAWFSAESSEFFRLDGRRLPPPAHVSVLVFTTDPALIPADIVALHGRGVRWDKAIGAWPAATVKNTHRMGAVQGFIDEIREIGDGPSVAMTA